ncbi:hypothetical protein T440DRAFT_389100 [Plenodomus tracheiphilus IPT5]|uniref:PQ-loop-domain-containing protein n=1 Tax=Plenodomus tracheiphilus IPT5 TaxID=1408161 RepID=A0A6A7BHU4_9PLEO|nr:hypothetical protein T440DRAFT_389100 [Plenodomus tracheiphilus IPT5]
MDVPAAANVLGTLGAVCALIPQIVINYRRHNATGLQPTMMMLWAWAGVPLGVYNIAENYNVALRIQPQILTLLSLVTWIQCYYYERQWSVPRSLAVVVPVACIMGAVQAGLIIAVRHAKQRDLHWPSILMAAASAALLAAGVLRHYVDVYLYRTVRGISFIFVGIDALGDVFSLVSVVFQPKLDILGMVIYGTELLLWIGIFICGAHYNLRPWIATRRNQKRGTQAETERSPTAPTQDTEHHTTVASAIALHDLPSSTSVFRTPSGDIEAIRRRSLSAVHHGGSGARPEHLPRRRPPLISTARRLRCSGCCHLVRLLSGTDHRGHPQAQGPLFPTLCITCRRRTHRSPHFTRIPQTRSVRTYYIRGGPTRATAAEMSTTTMTAVGSPYSASGAPSVPNPTPNAEYDDRAEMAPPDINFAAVTKILAPIQELLNESADDARCPSPPINTPNVLSPAPSIISRYRIRSLSAVNDRLDKLKIDDRKYARRDADAAYSSPSVDPSIAEDEEYEMASISEVLSDAGKDKSGFRQHSMSLPPLVSPTDSGSVHIALGSPTFNPRIEEYLSFTSKDLPTKAPAECIPSTLVENGNLSFDTAVHPASSRNSMKSEGVTEKSNWAEDVEDNIDHACMRLEQLAQDEHVADPSKSADEYYVARLERLLRSRKRAVPVKIEKI